MFEIKTLKIPIIISSKDINDSIHDTIKKKIQDSLLHKILKQIGIVVEILEIKRILNGDILTDSGSSKHYVYVQVKLYVPKIKEIIKSPIKFVDKYGVWINELEDNIKWNGVFVQVNDTSDYNIGDVITVKITQVKFLEELIVTGIIV